MSSLNTTLSSFRVHHLRQTDYLCTASHPCHAQAVEFGDRMTAVEM